MKLCFLSYKLSTGGFTASLLPLLHRLQEENIEIELRVFEKSEDFSEESIGVSTEYITQEKVKMSLLKRVCFVLSMQGAAKRLAVDYLRAKFRRTEEAARRYLLTWTQICQRIEIERDIKILDLSRFDCVISWEETYPNYYLAERVKAKRKVGYIHPDYIQAHFCDGADYGPYSKLDKIAFVSQRTKKSFCTIHPALTEKAVTIPNIIDVERVRRLANSEMAPFQKSAFDIVTVCRLDKYSKALDRAIEIANELMTSGHCFRWYIVGEGFSRKDLENQIKQYQLENVVILVGQKANPYPYMKYADLFVLQSNYEGKPLVVDEAMIVGTPVLVTNYASAYEQVSNAVTGFVVANQKKDIYDKLSTLICEPAQLQAIRDNIQSINTDEYADIVTFIDVVTAERDGR